MIVDGRLGTYIDETDHAIENINYGLSGERDKNPSMQRIIMNASNRKHHPSLFLWSLGGFIIGATVRCADILPDFFRRGFGRDVGSITVNPNHRDGS